jgi:predicted Rossmann fold nucleotide-binding protein DprA/Smf involved in DNA uptake
MTPNTHDAGGSTAHADAAGRPVLRPAEQGRRDIREVVRDEQVMRRRILAALADGPLTVPEIAVVLERPTHEVMFWVMGLRKYGWLAEIKEVTDEGYYRYQVVEREGS